jgi:FkbM family methyltransferase
MNFRVLLEPFLRRRADRRDRLYLVGSYSITLPAAHQLDHYQQQFLNYDKKLPVIAAMVATKYPDTVIVDIGGNVGDSAAALRSAVTSPIVCVEGNPAFLPYLNRNLAVLPGTNRIIARFVGPADSAGAEFGVATANGTAHLVPVSDGSTHAAEHLITVADLLAQNSDLGTVRLFKTDTDGFDFSILEWAAESLAAVQPVLFFEFDPSIGMSSAEGARQAVDALLQIGYARAVVYDNFGNYLLGTDLSPSLAHDLVASALQRKRAGGGAYYFDLCCFAPKDEDLFGALVQRERESVAPSSALR